MLNYRKIDSTPQERISNAIVFSKDKPKGFVKPEVKELTVLQDGIDFKVVFKISAKLSPIWKEYYQQKDTAPFFDIREALEYASQNDGYIDDGSGNYVTMPLENCIPEDTPRLTPEQVETRLKVFVTIANMCAQPDIVAKILEKMPKKKNKTLHKGRKQDIAYLDIVDQRGWTYQLVAKNESDTQLCIEIRNKVPVVADLVDSVRDLVSQSSIFF